MPFDDMPSAPSLDAYDRLIAAIYRAGMNPDLWQHSLHLINTALHGVSLSLCEDDLRRHFETGTSYPPDEAAAIVRSSDHDTRLDPAVIRDRLVVMLDTLGPHIRRAFGMQKALAARRVATDRFAAALDTLPNAALLLDREGRIAHRNAPAEAMLADGEFLRRDRHGVLQVHDPAARSVFESQFALIVSRSESEPRPIALSGVDTVGIRLATLTPFIPDDGAAPADPATPVALFAFAPERMGQEIFATILQSHPAATPAQTRLARAMMQGRAPTEYDRSTGLHADTARTGLENVPGKTGTDQTGEPVAPPGEESRSQPLDPMATSRASNAACQRRKPPSTPP